MLTPQDVQNKVFTKAVFGGYDMSAVDDFLEELSEDYAALYKDNAILKGKIKVLVEKVEEYRSTEDAMRMALLTAQKMGDDLVADAKEKSDKLIANADFEAKKKIEDLQYEIDCEETRLKVAKAETEKFIEQFSTLVKEHSEFLVKLKEISVDVNPEVPVSAEDVKEAQILDTTEEIEATVSKIFDEAAAEEAAEQVSEPAAEPAAPAYDDEGEPTKLYKKKSDASDEFDDDEFVSPRPKFDFENLQFGSNYTDADK